MGGADPQLPRRTTHHTQTPFGVAMHAMSQANSSLLLPSLRAENARLLSQAHEFESALARLRGAAWEPPMPRRLSAADSKYEFTQERLLKIAPKKQVLISFVNIVRIDFARTWVHHVRELGMTNWLVGATDQRAFDALKGDGTECFDMKTNLPQGEWPWGSPSFKSLGPHKIELIYKTLKWGFEMVITDIDALVLREPFAFMARWPDAGFLTTTDHLSNTTNDGGLENHRGIHSAFNIGYMFFRKSAMPLVEEWRRVIREQPKTRWDQGEFNRLARYQWKPHETKGLSDPRLFWSYKQVVIGGVLPLSLFCGGHNYFVGQFAQRMGWKPYSIHTTFQYGGAPGKRHRLREAGVWVDPPKYYEPQGGVLAMAPLDVPEALIKPPGGMDVRGHIKLINHQLEQIRNGLALATALGRKLVLPEVICGYDKAWYALSSGAGSKGVFGGAPGFAVPIYKCPLDHFLEPASLRPANHIREYSFLDNPRVPKAFMASSASVAISTDGSHADELRKLQREHAETRVLRVTNKPLPPIAAGGWLDSAEQRKFQTKFQGASGSWCCAPGEDAKHGQPRSSFFRLLNSPRASGLRRSFIG